MIFFESRNIECKRPFGAVKSGEEITLTFRVRQDVAVKEVRFVLQKDGGSEHPYPMTDKGEGKYELCLSLTEIGLYFYRFEVIRADGSFLFVGRGEKGRAVVGDWLPRWKLTVYHADFDTADKWKGGVMYQIFPDRFARCSDQRPAAVGPGTRYFHTDTADTPYDYTDPTRPGGKDYFGGSIEGVREKLPYLKELGVTVIYFNPVFESGENHRYSTADYMKIDPYFGTEEGFVSFCAAAKEQGIEVILDGVFSHTGADSVYFNKENYYDTLGAYNSPDSPYYSWYQFEKYPDRYAGWWGFQNLPNVNETDPAYLEFITGEQGVLSHWQGKGASGWRLDVADELPDAFLEALRRRVKAEDPDSLIIGEVWEHAVEKHSYGARRRFL
ncbi:MAG: glycoside hydrolase family 13 protein, partial [Clostridia bacterium]|nr:glycoside hydrolase family 13 protein [Clostridia bacterium]